MAKGKYKYNINHYISLLPREVTIADIVSIMEKEGISQDSFYRDRNIAFGSDQSIPADRFFIYADLFECTLGNMLAGDRKPIPSIRARILKSQLQTVSRQKLKNYLS